MHISNFVMCGIKNITFSILLLAIQAIYICSGDNIQQNTVLCSFLEDGLTIQSSSGQITCNISPQGQFFNHEPGSSMCFDLKGNTCKMSVGGETKSEICNISQTKYLSCNGMFLECSSQNIDCRNDNSTYYVQNRKYYSSEFDSTTSPTGNGSHSYVIGSFSILFLSILLILIQF